jgi:hypothetical protein
LNGIITLLEFDDVDVLELLEGLELAEIHAILPGSVLLLEFFYCNDFLRLDILCLDDSAERAVANFLDLSEFFHSDFI